MKLCKEISEFVAFYRTHTYPQLLDGASDGVSSTLCTDLDLAIVESTSENEFKRIIHERLRRNNETM